MCWGSLAGKCVVGVSDPSVTLLFRRLGGGKESATQREVDRRYCCQSTEDKAPRVFTGPTLNHQSNVPITL